MVSINGKTSTGESVGAKVFHLTDTLALVLQWLAQATGNDSNDIALCQDGVSPIAGSPAQSATLQADGTTTIDTFFGLAGHANAELSVVVTAIKKDSTAPAAAAVSTEDANARIRALFQQPVTTTTAARRPHHPQHPQQQQQPVLSPEEQARIDEINENFASAMEHTPEHFVRVEMLFVPCEINKNPITAFVDSGAQRSFMSTATAERCGLSRLIDDRPAFTGVAIGVGEQKILGSIHMVLVNLNGLFIPFSFSVMEKMEYDVIIGLDQLRRHQMVLSLADCRLHIGDSSVPFLSEQDVALAMETRKNLILAKQQTNEEEEQQTKKQAGNAPAPTQAPPATTAATAPAGANEEEEAPVEPTPGAAAASATPSQAEQDERMQQLMTFTGLEQAEEAKRLLIVANWDLEAAAALFYSE